MEEGRVGLYVGPDATRRDVQSQDGQLVDALMTFIVTQLNV